MYKTTALYLSESMANLYILLNVIYNVCTEQAKLRTDKGTSDRVQKRT
jgi:hypothetical protein